MKKAVSFLLVLVCILSVCAPAYAEGGQSRVVIGADLSEEQIGQVYNAFGIERGSITELQMTNAEERKWLEGYVDPALIGTRSISCVYVALSDNGSGMDVSTSNISWCTPEMYIAALATAGITDAEIIVAAPFEVSGTAALCGIYKAYEDITGLELSETAKLVSTQELTITGELAEEIGSMDSTAIVNELKLMLEETVKMSDEELRAEILEIASRFNVKLSSKQVEQLISLCRSLENLDTADLKSRVEDIQETLKKIATARTKVVSFVERAKKVISSIQSFFERIKDIFSRR